MIWHVEVQFYVSCVIKINWNKLEEPKGNIAFELL